MSDSLQAKLLRRRTVLEGALSMLALPMLPLGGCGDDRDGGREAYGGDAGFGPPPPSDGFESSRAGVDAYFTDAERDAIVRIGLARLEMLDDPERDLEPTLGLFETAADAAAPIDLRAAVQADFDDARSVLVEGWVLSRTEADLAALFAILHA
jgi:hypothetical protein